MNDSRQQSSQARIHLAVSWGVLSAIFFTTHAASGQCPDCPAPEPIPEIARGWNLYWHNPCQCMEENCYPSTCSTSLSPTWYVMAELMPLYRDESGNVIYQRDGTTGENVLTAGGFDSEFNAGGRFLLGVALGDYYRLEGSYVGSYEWDDTLAARNTDPITQPGQAGIGNLYSPYGDFGDPAGIPGLDFNQVASINYSSKMENLELNLRRRVQLLSDLNFHRDSLFNQGEPLLFHRRAETSVLVGIRYMKIDERFGYLTGSSVPGGAGATNSVNISADNAMIGAQLGLLSQFLILPRTWVDFEIKGVLFQNQIEVQSSYLNTDNAGNINTEFSGRDNRDRTAFLGEISLMYNHQVTRALTFRAGYTAMWVTEVALATQNFSDNINITEIGPVLAQHDGDVVYHGPSLGLVFAY